MNKRFIVIVSIIVVAAIFGVVVVALIVNSTKPATDFQSPAVESVYDVPSYQYGAVIDDASGEITKIITYGSSHYELKKGETLFKFYLDYLMPESNKNGYNTAYNVGIQTTLWSDVVVEGVSYSSYADLFITVPFDALANYYNEHLIGSVDFGPSNEEDDVYYGDDPLSSAFTAMKSGLSDADEAGLLASVQLVSNGIGEATFDDAIAADFNAGFSAKDAYWASENRKLIPEGCPQGQRASSSPEGPGMYACVDATPSTVQPPNQLIEYNFVCSKVQVGVVNSEEIAATFKAVPGFEESTVVVSSSKSLEAFSEKPCGFNLYSLQSQTGGNNGDTSYPPTSNVERPDLDQYVPQYGD